MKSERAAMWLAMVVCTPVMTVILLAIEHVGRNSCQRNILPTEGRAAASTTPARNQRRGGTRRRSK